MAIVRKLCIVACVFATLPFLASVLTASVKNRPISAAPAEAAPAFPASQWATASSLPADVLISPEELAKILRSSAGEKPIVIHVGPYGACTRAHIPGSESTHANTHQEVMKNLRKNAKRLPRNKFIVLYCGG